MAACPHVLVTNLEVWDSYCKPDGTCSVCGVVMDEKRNLQAQLAEVQTENKRLQTENDWMLGGILETKVSWNLSSQHTLYMMCEAYSEGKQEVRRVRGELTEAQARLKAVQEYAREYGGLTLHDIQALVKGE